MDQHHVGGLDELEEWRQHLADRRLPGNHVIGDPVDGRCCIGNVAAGIDQLFKPAKHLTIQPEADRRHLNQFGVSRRKPGGLGIKRDESQTGKFAEVV